METEIEGDLLEILNQFDTLPFIFVGSGISRRYLDLEDWERILTKFSEKTGKPFSYYRSSADGDLTQASKLIANDFHRVWFEITPGNEIKNYEEQLINYSSPIKIEISKYLEEKSRQIVDNQQIKEELEWFKKAIFDGIITTNWDVLLEHLFPDYMVFVGQEELLNSTPQMIGEIYKIHGSCSKPNTLVLTSDDYVEFQQKNPYLIAKLLTLFIEHPIIFIGYSLNDPNIREILNSVVSCLNVNNLKKMEKQLIFIEWDKDKKGDRIYTDHFTTGERTIPITIINTDNFSAIYQALSSLDRKIPTRILRHIKEQLYEIVVTNDPNDKIAILLDIDDNEQLKNAKYVVGFGEISSVGQIGYDAVKNKHLFRDLIFNDLSCDPLKVVKTAIPRLLSGNRKYIPIFKYLRKVNVLTQDGYLHRNEIDQRIIELSLSIARDNEYFAIPQYQKKKQEIRGISGGIPELIKRYGIEKMLYYIPLMDRKSIKIEELESFLRENFERFETEGTSGTCSFYHRIACLYDWLKFGGFDEIKIIE